MPPFSHSIETMRAKNWCAKLPSMPKLKYTPGQRVRINENVTFTMDIGEHGPKEERNGVTFDLSPDDVEGLEDD